MILRSKCRVDQYRTDASITPAYRDLKVNGYAFAPSSISRFFTPIVQDGERTLILSSCQICGVAKIGSSYDGSLQEWESDHFCDSLAVCTSGKARSASA